jgi:hypothetical protein
MTSAQSALRVRPDLAATGSNAPLGMLSPSIRDQLGYRDEAALERCYVELVQRFAPAPYTAFKIANDSTRFMWATEEVRRLAARRGHEMKRQGARRGSPDQFFAHGGKALFLELKIGDGKLSRHQKDLHGELAEAGIPVVTVRSLGEVIAAWTRYYGGIAEDRGLPLPDLAAPRGVRLPGLTKPGRGQKAGKARDKRQ